MPEFSIGEIARRAELRPQRYVTTKKIGLLPVAKRVSGKRRYDERILQKIGVIRLAKQAGLTIDEIQNLAPRLPTGDSTVRTLASLSYTENRGNWTKCCGRCSK